VISHGVFILLHEDPEGIFYYDGASDMAGNAKAKVLKVTVNGKNYVQIKFYTEYENETYAEVCCVPLLFLSFLTMSFRCASSSPKIPYALFPISTWPG
jgi:hypothetical protein